VYSKQKWRKKIFGGVKIVGSCSEIGTILTFYSNKTRKNAIVEYLDYQIPVTQLMGPKGNEDMKAAK